MSSANSILFICGSLELGRDGVGDYTRMLAAQLGKLGWTCKVVALYDKEVKAVATAEQPAVGVEVATIRIPRHVSDVDRFVLLQAELTMAQPSWVSLQFVPYSFDSRGLPRRLAKNLAGLDTSARLHIMFHELWIVHQGLLDVKAFVIEALQRKIISNLLDKVVPAIVTTHLPLYRDRLAPRSVSILPLFGNIPVATAPAHRAQRNAFRPLSFGSAPSPAEFSELAAGVNAIARGLDKPVAMRFLGHGGKHKAGVLSLAKAAFGEGSVTDVGPLDEAALSREFQSADLGLAKNSGDIIGKSGSAVAMLEHGLPLLVAGGRPPEPSVAPYFSNRVLYVDEVKQFGHVAFKKPESTARLVAKQFEALLSGIVVQTEEPTL